MSFILQNWSRQSSAGNCGQDSQGQGGMGLFTYQNTVDAVATIEAAGYFLPAIYELSLNDMIFIQGSDAFVAYQVATIDRNAVPQVLTIQSVGLTGSVGTANINNGAVTAAKIAANVIGDGQVTANALSSASLALNTIQYVQVAMTAAQWNGMYAMPFLLVAAPGTGKRINVDEAVLRMTFVAAQYGSGGAVGLQYDSTAHGAGTAASVTLAAATVNAYAASSNVALAGALASSAITTTENKGLYISNATGAFTTGDGTWHIDLWYSIVTA